MHCLRMVLTSDAATTRGTIKIHRLPPCHLKEFQPVPFILMLISSSRDISSVSESNIRLLISDIYEEKSNFFRFANYLIINLYLIYR